MTGRWSQRQLELAVFAVAMAWLAVTGTHAGAGTAIAHAVVGAIVLAAVVAAARQLVPREPFAGVIGAVILVLAPPFRDAIAFDLATTVIAGAAVIAVIAAGCARAHDRRTAAVLAGVAIAATAIAATGVLGPLPPLVTGLDAIVTATGRGAATIVVAAGLLGAGFGALTGLPGARVVIVAIAIAAIVGLGVPLLAVLAIGAAIVPAAVVRAAAGDARGLRRHAITLAAGLPLLAGSAIIGAAVGPTAPTARATTPTVSAP